MAEEPESTDVATAEDAVPATDALPPELVALVAEVAGLRTEIARGHERAAAREHVIDVLHRENERLRGGELLLLLRPILTDLQRLRHEMLRAVEQVPEQMSGRQATDLLRSYAHNLELTLERGGVEVVAPRPGDPVDPVAHRVTGIVDATGPDQDATVAEVVRDGYRDTQSGRVVLAAAVRVHRWVPPADAVPAETDEPGQPAGDPHIEVPAGSPVER